MTDTAEQADLEDGEVIELTVDLNDLTIAETRIIEDVTGHGLSTLSDARESDLTLALAYIALRRRGDDVTVEEVAEMKLGAFGLDADLDLKG